MSEICFVECDSSCRIFEFLPLIANSLSVSVVKSGDTNIESPSNSAHSWTGDFEMDFDVVKLDDIVGLL